MSYRLAFETMSEEHVGSYAELSRLHFTRGDNAVCLPAHLAWKHLHNPQGVSTAYHLYDRDALIGRIAYQRREFRLCGRTLRGAYLSDLLIHPQHRGMSTFLKLMRQVREAPGVDFVYTAPNSISAPLFKSVLKFQAARPMTVLAWPLRAGSLLREKLGLDNALLDSLGTALLGLGLTLSSLGRRTLPASLRLSDEIPSDSELDALADDIGHHDWLDGVRSARFHNWRFHQSPYYHYRVSYVYQDGSLVGYAATRSDEYEGYRCLFLIDLVFRPDVDRRALRSVMHELLRRGRQEGCDLALGFFIRRNAALARLCNSPLVEVPARYLPQHVDLYVEPLTGCPPLPGDLTDLYLTMADLDVF